MFLVVAVLCYFLQVSQTLSVGTDKRKNVLMIIADDLRPEIGAFYDKASQLHPYMYTPNMDNLAGKSAIFKNAHVQFPQCGPSRNSFLTSRRPHTSSVLTNGGNFRTVNPTMVTLPQMFKENGYKTLGAGKVFHSGDQDYPLSWDEPIFEPPHRQFWQKMVSNYIATDEEIEADPLPDTEIADYANKTLQQLATGDQPFFLALGFIKPHLTFLCPERLLKHYPVDKVSIADNQYAPHDFPPHAWYNSAEFARMSDIQSLGFKGEMNETLPAEKAREVRRAYYCTVSHVDEELGRVLTILRDLGLDESTIVTFSGDHGWQLGEHSQWGKETNFYLSTRTPLMIHDPSLTKEGQVINDIVEFVDLMPTLADAAGLSSIPYCPTNASRSIDLCTEGTSLLPLIKEGAHLWKRLKNSIWGSTSEDNVAYSQYLHGDKRSGEDDEIFMEYSVQDGRYHFTKVVGHHGSPDYMPDWDADYGDQLYDTFFDPDENVNVVHKPDYQDIRARLEALLYRGFPN